MLFLLIVLKQGLDEKVVAQSVRYPLTLKKSIGRSLRPADVHTYNLFLQRKQVIRIKLTRQGTDATIRVMDSSGEVVSRRSVTMGEYDEELSLFQAPHAGLYTVTVRSAQKNVLTGHYTIELNELLSGEAYTAQVAKTRRKQTAVIRWLKERAIPLATLSVDSNRTDLTPLKDVLRDVRFIGIGEETHGTHEFFASKHRLLDFLVREMGVRVVVIEGSYVGWQLINDYVMGRTDDGAKALAEQGFWAWDTDEMKTLIDWARQYNRTVPSVEQLRFSGVDPQYNQPGKDSLLTYLKRVAPKRVPSTKALFALNLDSLQAAHTGTGELDTLKQVQASYYELYTFLEQSYKQDTTGLDSLYRLGQLDMSGHERMLGYARVLTQYVSTCGQADTAGVATRDMFMAENCRRLIERESAGTRFVIWGHNGHIATGGNSLFKPLGAYLREFYGSAYYALGLGFNKGTFLAREVPVADSARQWLKAFGVNPAPEQSIEWYLAQTKLKTFIVDFRAAPQNAHSKNWLTESIPMRSIGSVYRPDFARTYLYPIRLNERFDGLLFIDSITRARPNPSVKDVDKLDSK
jgi:erythromycin esterase